MLNMVHKLQGLGEGQLKWHLGTWVMIFLLNTSKNEVKLKFLLIDNLNIVGKIKFKPKFYCIQVAIDR